MENICNSDMYIRKISYPKSLGVHLKMGHFTPKLSEIWTSKIYIPPSNNICLCPYLRGPGFLYGDLVLNLYVGASGSYLLSELQHLVVIWDDTAFVVFNSAGLWNNQAGFITTLLSKMDLLHLNLLYLLST